MASVNRISDFRQRLSNVKGWELLWSELFSAPAYNFSREDRTIQPQRDFVRFKVRPLARLGSGETAHDFALWIDL